MPNRELIAAILTIVIGLSVCVVAAPLPFRDPHTVIGPGAMPLTIGILIVFCGCVMIGLLRKPTMPAPSVPEHNDADEGDDLEGSYTPGKPAVVLILLVACALLLRYVSFGAGALVLVSGYQILVAERHWVPALGIGIACVVVSYGLFHTLLGAPISLLP